MIALIDTFTQLTAPMGMAKLYGWGLHRIPFLMLGAMAVSFGVMTMVVRAIDTTAVDAKSGLLLGGDATILDNASRDVDGKQDLGSTEISKPHPNDPTHGV